MHLTIGKKDLADAIARAAQGLANRPYQPVYANMHLHACPEIEDVLYLTCSDGFMTFQASARCDTDGNWSCIIPGRVLAEIAKYFPAKAERVDISCDLTAGLVTITAGRSVFTLTASPGDDFPATYQPASRSAVIKATDFREAVLKVAPAVAIRHTNPALTGILFQADGEILSLVATDSYCMAHVPVGMDLMDGSLPETPVVVPVAAAERFARLAEGDITMGWDDRIVTLETQGLVVISRQIEGGTFPPGWAGILAHDGGWTTIETAELIRAVRVAALIAPQPPGDRVVLEFDGNDLNVTARGLGECAEYVTTDYSGDTARFIFGAKMLLTGLAGSEEQIRLAFVPGGNRVLLESGALRFIMVPRKDTEGEE